MRRAVRLGVLRTLLFVCLCVSANAMQKAQGWCQLGAQQVNTVGIQSTNFFQQTFKSCTVTVYLNGTLTLATLFSTNTSTPQANPFTASSTGFWSFYAANGRYDVSLTGGGIVGTITYSDVLLLDLGSSTGLASINSQTGPAITLQSGTTGADFGVSNPSSNVVQINCPTASGTNRGCLSSADWTAFNSKSGTLIFTAPLVNTAGTVSITFPFGISQGGTGQTTQSAAFNALSPLTTKGDFLGNNGSANVRVPIGADGTVATADSTQGVGWRWIACPFCALTDPLTVSHGGTGLTGGTSGGAPCYTGATTLASSAVFVSGAPLLGGGAGNCPTTSGAATTYNGQALAGNGLASVVFNSQVQSNQTSTHSAQVVLTAPTAATYLVSYYLTTGSVTDGTATAQVTFNWTDTVGAKATTPLTALALGAAANQTATYLISIASGNLTYTSTYSAGAGGNYNLTVVVQRL